MHAEAKYLAVKKPAPFSLVITAVLFITLQLVATPLLNSGDDAFLMYTLAGGYGEEPTNLLHYNHIWHPALGWIVKSLFAVAPGINWYVIVVLLFHYAGCVLILYTLLLRTNAANALLLFLIFFFFFESRLLLSPGFTGAAFVAATGSLFYLHFVLSRSEKFFLTVKLYLVPAGWKKLILPALVLLAAGMLRLQIVWLVSLLFLPLAICSLRESLKKWVFVCAGVIFLLFLLNRQQVAYYKKHIPGWAQQEEFRQSIFYAYNRPLQKDPLPAFADSAEMQLFFSGFLYDKSKFTSARLNTISHQITRQRWLNASEDREGLHWLFMELRIYLLLFGVAVAGLLLQRRKEVLFKWLWSLLAVVLVYGGLFVFLKLTPPIHIGLIGILWIHLAGYYRLQDHLIPPGRKWRLLPGFLLLACFAWMGARIIPDNQLNKQRRQKFYCALQELNSDRNKLFIATDDNFPLSYFYAWDLPRKYPATNLLYKDRLLAGSYKNTLDRFRIQSVDTTIVKNENVYFLGKPVPALEKIMQAKYSGRFPGYKCLEVRKLLGAW